jgi:uncharacterized protein (TIGR02145 family)
MALCDGKPYSLDTQFCYNNSKIGNFCGINPQKYYNPDLYECKQNSNGIYLKNGLTDTRDSNKYDAVLIGTQVWISKNLNYNATNSKCGGYPLSNVNTSICDTYGRLYNWVTAMNISDIYYSNLYGPSANTNYKGVCPTGWHLPTQDEWGKLMEGVGDVKYLIAMNNGNGTDAYGFAALFGGYGSYGSNSTLNALGTVGYWWSSSESSYNSANGRIIHIVGASAGTYISGEKREFYSVRCLKTSEEM